jgi:glycosyltransferase involved in cell wall biosynthesis
VGLCWLLWKSRSRRFDAIYERYSLYNFVGVVAARLLRIPIILEVNSPFALEQTREGQITARKLARYSEAWICKHADWVIVVSSPLRRIMVQAGVRPEKLVVMPNGVNPEQFRPRGRDAALASRLQVEDKFVIGFVGWFRKWHGLEILVDAFEKSGLAQRSVVLMLIGDGQAGPELRAHVRARGLDHAVRFTGPLPHHEIAAHIALFNAAVQPAANEYCCPMKIFEYMAAGKAVIAPRQENITEFLREDQECVYFEPGCTESLAAALLQMAGNSGKCEEMGVQAAEAVHKRGYLWTANAEAVVELIRSTPSRRGPAVQNANVSHAWKNLGK